MSQINELQHLTEQQLPQAIAMIGRAFHKDPLSIYVYPDEAERGLLASARAHHLEHQATVAHWCSYDLAQDGFARATTHQ